MHKHKKNTVNIRITQDLKEFLLRKKLVLNGKFETFDALLKRLTNFKFKKGGFLE